MINSQYLSLSLNMQPEQSVNLRLEDSCSSFIQRAETLLTKMNEQEYIDKRVEAILTELKRYIEGLSETENANRFNLASKKFNELMSVLENTRIDPSKKDTYMDKHKDYISKYRSMYENLSNARVKAHSS